LFYIECYADETLISFVLHKLKLRIILIHASNKSGVLKELSKRKAFGLVDEDPMAPQGIVTKDFHEEIVDEILQVKIHRNSRSSHLIVLCPRLEDWLLRICRLSKVDISKYSLPRESRELHKVINQKKRNLETLLEALYKKSKIFLKFTTLLNRIISKN